MKRGIMDRLIAAECYIWLQTKLECYFKPGAHQSQGGVPPFLVVTLMHKYVYTCVCVCVCVCVLLRDHK